MSTTNWRLKPLARAIVLSNCWLLVVSGSGSVCAAPAANQLPVAASVLVNPNQGSASVNTVGNKMTVNQNSNKTILNWKSFDIGKDANVQFVQPSAQAIALNKIGDSAASQIFGKLGANGTIYLINNNGILFGQGAQVNVHSLLASTLNIDPDRFMNSSILSAIDSGKAALEGGSAADAAIVVEAGAKISTDGNSGQILMFAPNVINNGEIRSPDGQTILAASTNKVYLTASDKDQDLRGILVEVDTGGNVKNVGQIVAERGNITLLGLAVNQEGRLTATTSVDVNGSIRLLARDGAPTDGSQLTERDNAKNSNVVNSLLLDDESELPTSSRLAIATRTGTVTIGANSTTEVIADAASGTAADAQPQNKSRIDVMGKTIAINAGASVVAKSGAINITATTTPDAPKQAVARDGSRLLIDSKATLDVSGEHVELPMERRTVTLELRGDELKDSPLQRNGVLRGKTVKVDVATGTPLVADLAPTLAKIQKGVKERMVEGGTINLHSQGDVVVNPGATFDTSGGSITYAAGLVNTTQLMTIDGRVVDIGKADPNQRYAGIFGEHSEAHPKWGIRTYGKTSTFTLGTYVDSFTEGENAGSLNIVAQTLLGFDNANIKAGAQRGPTQRALNKMPAGGAINVVLGQADRAESVVGAIQDAVIDQVSRGQIYTLNDSAPLSADRPVAYFSAERINASGAGSFSLATNGHIDVGSNTNISLAPGAKFALTGRSLDFDGKVSAASGSVSLKTTARANTENEAQTLTLGAGSAINVNGLWSNDALDIKNKIPLSIIAPNGGSIDIGARGNLTIAEGAQLHADAGAQLTNTGTVKGGNGGNIKFATNAQSSGDLGSTLALNGNYSAYGFGNGGKLTLEANAFQIGGDAASDARIFHIDPIFFTRGGFSDYTLTSNLIGVDVASSTVIAPLQSNYVVANANRLARINSGADINSALQVQTLTEYDRNPTNLHLNALQTAARTSQVFETPYLRINTGAAILADNGATLDLTSAGSIYVDGTLRARGGNIRATIQDPQTAKSIDHGYVAKQALWLGSHAALDVAATVERALDPLKKLLDHVFDAGSIDLTAERGFIVAEPGSSMDVSGASYTIDLPRSSIERSRQRSVKVNGGAGAIALTAADGIVSYAAMKGKSAGDGYAGQLSFALDASTRLEGSQAQSFPYFPLEINVSENLPQWNSALIAGGVLPNALRGKALVSASDIRESGFGSLTLSAANRTDLNSTQAVRNYGSIVFGSDVDLALSDNLSLNSRNIDVAGHAVNLSAATLSVGRDDGASATVASQMLAETRSGNGKLGLHGAFIDVLGNVGISGAADTELSSAADLRFRSVIDAADQRQLASNQFTTTGNLLLRAAQIYPSTFSDFTIRAIGDNAVLSTALSGAGTTSTPILSAGGKLVLSAATIEHGGNLIAPLGTVELDATQAIHLATGSSIDVSSNVLIPYGRLLGSDLYWTYPIISGQPLTVDKVPQKNVALSAPSIKMDSGATVNLSGGGDIYAFEQIPGPGGSKDFLSAENAKGAFAVVPWLSSLATPYDAVEMQGFNIALGTTVWLPAANGLAAGNYAVLPAHYALLPGAYLITPTGDALPGVVAKGKAIDGTPVVTGRFGRALSGQYASQWQSFSIETSKAVRLRSEFKESTGAEFFKDDKVDLAADAGRMSIAAQAALELNGSINAAAQNGRGAQLDIIADKIAVVADLADDVGEGVIKLAASALNKLGVDSLMLGGTRTRDGDDTNVAVSSSNVTIGSGAQLQVPDIILAARDSVVIKDNASVAGSGNSTVNTRAFVIDGDGALLRASSAEQSNVQRTNSSGAAGDLQIAASARLAADKSLLLDSSRSLSLPNAIALEQGSLNISANRISLGDVPANTSGAALSNAQLNTINAQELRLSSRSSIDLFGSVTLQNNTTTLNTGALRSMQPGDTRIAAGETLQLQNGVNGSAPDGTVAGGGNLILAAKNIVLGSDKDRASTLSLDGFSQVQIGEANRTETVRGAGEFTLRTPAVTVYADNIGAASAGAKTHLIASDNVVLNKANVARNDANAAATSSVNSELGAQLTIEGRSIRHDTAIALPSGIVNLNATDEVVLGGNAAIDVGGESIALQHASINTAGGTVNLTARNGSVRADSGASVNISGAQQDGDAGTLNISATNGGATWSGALIARAASNARGGNLIVDAALLNADALIEVANSAGVNNNLTLRARSGDVAINRDTHANKIAVSADAGALTLAATLDASGANGGNVALYARDDLTLQSNAAIVAKGNGDANHNTGRGGTVELGSSEGALRFAAGSAIDVSGNTRGGIVDLRAVRNASNDGVAVFNSGIAITGAERIQLAAVKAYTSSIIDGVLLAQMQSDAVAFFGDGAHEAQLRSSLGGLENFDNFHLVPEFEVRSNGDMAVATEINFAADKNFDGVMDSDWRFGVNAEAPVLSLRAAGNLTVAQSIRDGVFTYDFDQLLQNGFDPYAHAITFLKFNAYTYDENGHAQPGIYGPLSYLLTGDSASLRLVAGSDLNAANPDTTTNSGNLSVSNGADIVTGTGSIKLAAGGNFSVANADSLIASVGNTTFSTYASPFELDGLPATETMPDSGSFNAIWAFLAQNRVLQYPKNGGDVSIAAKGDIDFAKATDFFSDWIARLGGEFKVTSGAVGEPERTFNLTTWGTMIEHLQQGIVALGGGNIAVNAGGNITNLNAATPSTGKQIGIDENVVELIRGGNLNVSAGGNILSPRLLVDNGVANVTAGGNIGATTGGLQTFAVLGDAALNLVARGSIGVDAVMSTTAMPQSQNQKPAADQPLVSTNYFFNYGDNSALNIKSLTGDIVFNNDVGAVLNSVKNSLANILFGEIGNEEAIFQIYPAKLNAQAASADIDIRNNVYLFPASTGQLTLLAGGDLTTSSASTQIFVRQSDTDPALLPSWKSPAARLDASTPYSDTVIERLLGDNTIATSTMLHASTPLHADDNEASVIDALGDIASTDSTILAFQLSEQARIGARDIIGTNFTIQNNRASDVSEIFAQRDFISPTAFQANGTLSIAGGVVRIEGPGRLDLFAGRNINLGAAEGVVSLGNQNNPYLPDIGASLNVLAGINGPTALTDPILLNVFADTYLTAQHGPTDSYIDWFEQGSYSSDPGTLMGTFTGKHYANRAEALADFAQLPVLTQQAISLEAYRTQRNSSLDSAETKPAYAALHGYADGFDYSASLIDFVSLERFGGDLRTAVSAVTGQNYATNTAAATALATLPAAQQQQIARAAFNSAPLLSQRELVSEIFFSELRRAGVENVRKLVTFGDRDGYSRGYNAIAKMFPGQQWQGDIDLVFSGVRSIDGGDINLYTPGGEINVGLAGQFAGFHKESGKLGIIAQRYGTINAFANNDININQSRIFSLDGGGITLWSTNGDIDAGRGAKTALTIPPPNITVDPLSGAINLVFPAAVSGSGIQVARNSRLTPVDRGALVTAVDDSTALDSDGRVGRDRFFRSLTSGTAYIFAPKGAVDAGDAGIDVAIAIIDAPTIRNSDNIKADVAIGVPTTTTVSSGTLSAGNAASSATDAATNSMNDAIKQTAAALAEGNVAFVTVDVIGTGR